MFEKLRNKIRQSQVKRELAKVKKEIESGERPRGRTLESVGISKLTGYGNGVIVGHTELSARHFTPDKNGEHRRTIKKFGFIEIRRRFREVIEDRRVVYDKVVTTAFVNFIVAQLQTETSIFGDFKYHDSGTGTGDEAVGNTTLGTPCGDARDAGSQTVGASNNIYKSVATHTYDESLAITEHGLFNADAAGTLMDRTKFAAINVIATDQIEFTFQITFTAGG